jgi:hypothetical protein
VKLTLTKVARLVEKRSDERDNVALTNGLREALNGHGLYFRSLTTTGATPGVIWQDTVNADSVLYLDAIIVGATASAAKQAKYHREVAAFRVAAGAATLIGAADVIGTDQETDATWDVAFGVTSGDVTLTVTSGAGDTAFWRSRVTALWVPYQ